MIAITVNKTFSVHWVGKYCDSVHYVRRPGFVNQKSRTRIRSAGRKEHYSGVKGSKEGDMRILTLLDYLPWAVRTESHGKN